MLLVLVDHAFTLGSADFCGTDGAAVDGAPARAVVRAPLPLPREPRAPERELFPLPLPLPLLPLVALWPAEPALPRVCHAGAGESLFGTAGLTSTWWWWWWW